MTHISLILLVTILSAYAFRWRGDDTLSKPEWLMLTALMCGATGDAVTVLSWFLVYAALGCFPTHSLFTAIHGRAPTRKDHWLFAWMQTVSGVMKGGKRRGIIYGVVRCTYCIPAFILCPSTSVALLHGVVYWIAGITSEESISVKRAELALGALLGLALGLQLVL